jgi:hypothetical protein
MVFPIRRSFGSGCELEMELNPGSDSDGTADGTAIPDSRQPWSSECPGTFAV